MDHEAETELTLAQALAFAISLNEYEPVEGSPDRACRSLTSTTHLQAVLGYSNVPYDFDCDALTSAAEDPWTVQLMKADRAVRVIEGLSAYLRKVADALDDGVYKAKENMKKRSG